MNQQCEEGEGLLGALDVGTTGVRFAVYTDGARPVTQAYREIGLSTPQPGWVEQDPHELLRAVQEVIREVVEDPSIDPSRLRGIGLANQRETMVAWDPSTGKALHPAIVWQDRRTAPRCQQLREGDSGSWIRKQTGLPIDPYFSATKIEWLLENVPAVAERAAKDRARFGTVDSWVLWHLTGEHVTDDTNASRTLLFNIDLRDWSEEILDLFGIRRSSLPRVIPSLSVAGQVRPGFLAHKRLSIPIAGVLGDQQAALLGQARVRCGEVQATWGTGAFLLMNCGPTRPSDSSQLVTTIACSEPRGSVNYALEGSVFVAGSAIQWLRDKMGLLESAADSEQLGRTVSTTDGVVFVPALTGLGCPHWDPSARGLIIGLTRGTRREHIVRAALEAIAYQTWDVVRTMEREAGVSLKELRVGGGASANDLLCQFQSDILGVPVARPNDRETTALGAALAAGLSVGLWDDPEDIRHLVEPDRWFTPAMSSEARELRLTEWHSALERARGWVTE